MSFFTFHVIPLNVLCKEHIARNFPDNTFRISNKKRNLYLAAGFFFVGGWINMTL